MADSGDPIPDWGWWTHVPTVTLFEAAALSVDFNPRFLQWHLPNYGGRNAWVDEFYDRLALVRRCIGETLPAAEPRDGEQYVRLGQFVTWALSIGWSLPSPLSACGDVASKTTPAKVGAADLHSVVAATISEFGQPGQNILWKKFFVHVRSRCGLSVDDPPRGYGDRTIRRVVKAIRTSGGATR